MRVVALNIQAGGGKRATAITRWLASSNADVIILPEWRPGKSGERLETDMVRRGFKTHHSARDQRNCNGLLVAARKVLHVERVTPESADKGELLLVRLPNDLIILAAYFPQLYAKAPFFEACIKAARRHADVPFLLIGDLNTGDNDRDIEGDGTPFHCASQFLELNERAGLCDLWRRENGDLRDWTWRSRSRSRSNGFRVDHAFGNRMLISRLVRCWYDHQPRTAAPAITDHSALIVELSDQTLDTALETARLEVILIAGVEGGGVSLYGERTPTGWRFQGNFDDQTLYMLDQPAIHREFRYTESLEEALALLGTRWYRLPAVRVHPEFRERIWAEFWRRFHVGTDRLDSMQERLLQRWRERCGVYF